MSLFNTRQRLYDQLVIKEQEIKRLQWDSIKFSATIEEHEDRELEREIYTLALREIQRQKDILWSSDIS